MLVAGPPSVKRCPERPHPCLVGSASQSPSKFCLLEFKLLHLLRQLLQLPLDCLPLLLHDMEQSMTESHLLRGFKEVCMVWWKSMIPSHVDGVTFGGIPCRVLHLAHQKIGQAMA